MVNGKRYDKLIVMRYTLCGKDLPITSLCLPSSWKLPANRTGKVTSFRLGPKRQVSGTLINELYKLTKLCFTVVVK